MFNLLSRKDTVHDTTTEPAAQRPRRVVHPPVDIREDDGAFLLVADLPGCDESGVDITVERGVLTLRATPKDVAPAGLPALMRERGDRRYERSFVLPDAINREAVAARMRDGVLSVTLPKAAAARPQRITVNAG
jgi:HSP20 family protein